MKFTTILIIMTLGLMSCSHKTLVKNCDQTQNGQYYVCDTVLWK